MTLKKLGAILSELCSESFFDYNDLLLFQISNNNIVLPTQRANLMTTATIFFFNVFIFA